MIKNYLKDFRGRWLRVEKLAETILYIEILRPTADGKISGENYLKEFRGHSPRGRKSG